MNRNPALHNLFLLDDWHLTGQYTLQALSEKYSTCQFSLCIYIYIKVMNWWERCVILQNWSVKPTIVTINATTALGLQASLDDSLGTPWGTGDLRHKLQKCDCAVAKLEMSFQLKINEMHLYTCKQISSATVKHQSSKLNTNPRIQQKNDISCAETICFELFRFRQAGTRDAEGNMNKICFAWNGQAWKC